MQWAFRTHCTDSVSARVGDSTDSAFAQVGDSADLMKMLHAEGSELVRCLNDLVRVEQYRHNVLMMHKTDRDIQALISKKKNACEYIFTYVYIFLCLYVSIYRYVCTKVSI